MIPEEEIIRRAMQSVLEFSNASLPIPSSVMPFNCRYHKAGTPTRTSRWIKPDPDFVKVNCDTTMKCQGFWGLSAIIINEEGLVMASATWRTPGNEDSVLAEACAMLKAMHLVKECGFRKVVFEGDSEKVVHMINKENGMDRSYLGLFIQEIQLIKSNFDKCNFRFTHRDNNKVADKLAHLAHPEPDLVWMEEVPLAIYDVYFHDLLN